MNPMNNRSAHGGTTKYHGAKWIRPAKRLAIYVRDGLACVYCGRGIEDADAPVLSLDHVECFEAGGSNDATNLLTACRTCNSSRGNRPFGEWVAIVASFRNQPDLLAHLNELRARPLDVAAAKAMRSAR